MSPKKILMINIGWEQEPLLQKLHALNHEIYAVHPTETPLSGLCKQTLIASVNDLSKIFEFALRNNIEAVIADQCDYSLITQAYISEKLELPGPSLKHSLRATNKFLQREFCRKHKILIPAYKLCTSLEEITIFAMKYSYPLVVKPTDNRGSIGVTIAHDFEQAKAAYFKAIEQSTSRLILVEQFIKGTEITIDGYCFEGEPKSLAIASKQHLEKRQHPVAMEIHYPPKHLSRMLIEKLLAHNAVVNKTLGFEFGMTHSEYLLTENDEIYLVESTNRGGGVFTSEIIVPYVTNVDLLEIYIKDCLGETLTRPVRFLSPLTRQVLLKFFSFQPGVIHQIIGLEEIYQQENVLAFKLLVNVGANISEITSDAERHGFMILGSESMHTNLSLTSHTLLRKLCIEYA